MEMLDIEGLNKEYRSLLKDYRVKIYNPRELEEENYETSLREIIAIFKRSKNREAMKQYYQEHKERFRELDLCKAFEDERAEGKAEGERIGREMGAFSTLCGLVMDGLIKMEEAAKRMNMSEEMFRKRMQELQ